MSSSSATWDGPNFSSVPEEYESEEREAYFFLYARPIKHAVLGYAEHRELYHWALVVVFSDESVRTLEGIQFHRKLVPHYLKDCPPQCRNEKYWKLIPIKISPYKLREVTINNRLNDTAYKATANNCQNWVKEAARAISLDLFTALENYKTNDEVNTLKMLAHCSWASSRSSSERVASLVKILNEYMSHSKDIEEQKLQ